MVVSADGHCGADLRDYRPYLEARYHEEFDRWAASYVDAWATLGDQSADIRVGAASFVSPYSWDGPRRMQVLETQGIVAEVLFPNTAPPFNPSGSITAPAPRDAVEYELRFAGVRAHNRWLADFCAQAPGRRAGIAQVFLDDVDAAVAEARWAKEHGLKGILLPADHLLQLSNLYYPRYDPFWAACVDLALPVGRHGVICSEPASAGGIGAPAVGLFEAYFFAQQRGIDHLVLSGVFERFPSLRFVVSEVNAAWAVEYGHRLDAFVAQALVPGTVSATFAREAALAMSLKPSEYIRRNCYFGTFFDGADVAARTELGVGHLMWGADFPHQEGTTPFSIEALRLNFSSVPEADTRAMLGENAADVYDLDLGALQGLADQIGPSPEEVRRPLTPAELPAFPDQTVCCTFAASRDWVTA